MSRLEVQAFFDKPTSTLTYAVWDSATRDAVVIDPVLDFDPATQIVTSASLGRLIKFVAAENLNVHWVLDTHAHADHLSSAKELKQSGIARAWGLGIRMNEVFGAFSKVFAWPKTISLQNLGVDRWFQDGEEFTAGSLRLEVMNTPGHTPACLTYRVGPWLFTGDALFMPDSGVGRCDFPGGSAGTLYDSIMNRLYRLDDKLEVFTGHDYQPDGRMLKYRSTLGEQKSSNIHLKTGTSREEFIRFREGRDKTLPAPRLLNPSLDWNLGAHQIVKRQQAVLG